MSTWSRPPISRTLPPHIFAGVSSVLYFVDNEEDFDEVAAEFLEPVTTAKDREKDEDFKDIINALVVAVYFLVLARRRTPSESSGDIAQEETRKMDKKTFSEMRQTALVSLGLPSSVRRHREDVEKWIALTMELNWAHGKEWFENVPHAGELDGDEAYLSDEGGDDKRQRTLQGERGSLVLNDTRRGLLPGLGTMMQDRVDWLSPENQEDYAEWKADILARIEQVEATT
jgi:origin recognition complex subunit 6